VCAAQPFLWVIAFDYTFEFPRVPFLVPHNQLPGAMVYFVLGWGTSCKAHG
jgi:hypothetical protein